MSELRRRMLMDNTGGYIPSQQWVEIAKITTIGTTEVSLPKYREIGFFIVGGGGSGHGDFSAAGTTGSGGNGGCVNSFIVPFGGTSCSVTVGSGGNTGASRANSNNGSASYVVYNGVTYISDGGYGGTNNMHIPNTKQENSGIGGFGRWGGYDNVTMYQWCANHIASEKYPGASTYGGKGEDGLPNPFDESDTNLYGAGGGTSQCAYKHSAFPSYVGPAISGGEKGGGAGGYGGDNTKANRGQNGSFYGAGGGGGSFSSSHAYSQGGAGYQGIIIIYGKSDE